MNIRCKMYANKHVKSCPSSLTFTVMQMETSMRYHFTPTRTATVFSKKREEALLSMWGNGATAEKVGGLLKKLKTELSRS